MTSLFPYQIDGANWLAGKRAALLADDMGLGKSAQAIAACDAVGDDGRVMVVCPASLVENWKREFDKFGTGRPMLTVMSYDRAARGEALALAEMAGKIDVLIIDEAHYAKNRSAKRTKAIYGPKCDGVGGLVERARHVFLLTGTPAPNNASELWTHLRALAPELIENPKRPGKPMAYWDFVQRYCKTRDNGFGVQIIGSKNLADLGERMKPFYLRRRKDEVLKDLPPIRFDQIYLEGKAPAEGSEAKRIAEVLDKEGIEGLQKIAPHVASLRRVTGLAKIEPVVAWVKEWFEGGGSKLVLFAHHREVIERLHDGLVQFLDPGPVFVTGSQEQGLRQYAVDEFQNDPKVKVFIGQIQAAGTGLTLTASSDVLFVESSWVPSDNQQAAMRVHRIGQRNACTVRFATLAGSIDEQIQAAVARKTADIAQLFG
ncbi:DEAD/DEAH box helicase [Rhodoligotrophos defluvii]|uniref:DEAD/DEAH box helicase n=1 Tax=Rhodoligotrophos defluvii TaxID=2561934 RepID=UPI0010C9F734|nr:DEAD/DEAH box helicase [Rhodoligotrophos defluvii]